MGYEVMGVCNFPDDKNALDHLLQQTYSPGMDIVVNCMHYWRDKDSKNRAHGKCIGEHCRNLVAALFFNDAKLESDFKYIKQQLEEKLTERASETDIKPVHICFMSRRGRHRSVALCRLTYEVLKRNGYNVTKEPVYLSQLALAWSNDQCWMCEDCHVNSEGKDYLYGMADIVCNSFE